MPDQVEPIILREMADELFQMQTLGAALRSRSRARGAADLTETEFLTLDFLVRHTSLTVGEIQRQIGVLPAQMSRVIKQLEKREDGPLVKCQINRSDKRKVDVEITKAGRILHKNYKQARIDGMMSFLEVLRKSDCREFMRICRLIRGRMEALLMH